MKKFLSLLAVALITMSANAQNVRTSQNLEKLKVVNRNEMSAFKVNKPSVKKVIAKAEGTLYTNYIMNCEYNDGDYSLSNGISLTYLSEPQKVEEDDRECNVQIDNFIYYGSGKALAIFDEEAGTLTIPNQVIGQANEDTGFQADYGDINFCPCVEEEGKLTIADEENNYYDLVFEFDDEGNLSLIDGEVNGYCCLIVYNEELTNIDDGFYPQLLAPNGVMTWRTTANSAPLRTDGGTSGWGSGEAFVNVMDYEVNYMVNGFFGMAPVSIDLNDDGTCTLELDQQLSYTHPDPYGYETMWNVIWDEEGYFVGLDYDRETPSIQGVIVGNTIQFYEMEPEPREDGYYYYSRQEYVYVASKEDENEQGYFRGICAAIDVQSDVIHEQAGTTGIQNANNTLEYKLKNTKTYNLMGQQVDRKAVKGLMIRDGKKYIAK